MAKRFEANEDWIKRDQGRIPTKGAAAAQRASAGLGVLNDDAALRERGIPLPVPLRGEAERPEGSNGTSV